MSSFSPSQPASSCRAKRLLSTDGLQPRLLQAGTATRGCRDPLGSSAAGPAAATGGPGVPAASAGSLQTPPRLRDPSPPSPAGALPTLSNGSSSNGLLG